MNVLEWSHRQNCFHVQTLEQSLHSNRAAFAQNRPSDYVIVATGTQDEVFAIANELRHTFKSRESGATRLADDAIARARSCAIARRTL